MTVTISRLYNNHDDARAAVRNLESAGVAHNDISIIASNADNWYSDDRNADAYPDRDLDGKDDRSEAAGVGAGIGAAAGGVAGLLAGLGIYGHPGRRSRGRGWMAGSNSRRSRCRRSHRRHCRRAHAGRRQQGGRRYLC